MDRAPGMAEAHRRRRILRRRSTRQHAPLCAAALGCEVQARQHHGAVGRALWPQPDMVETWEGLARSISGAARIFCSSARSIRLCRHSAAYLPQSSTSAAFTGASGPLTSSS